MPYLSASNSYHRLHDNVLKRWGMTLSNLTLDVIGDSGPFSRLGKSIGYLLEVGDSRYLVDCGAPIFQILGSDGLNELDGIIATHGHEDHKRWFTDFALYQKFNRPEGNRVTLYGSRTILENYRVASAAAFEKTLSANSDRIRTLTFDDFVESVRIGPEPRYRIEQRDDENGPHPGRVVDRSGEPCPPDRAKIVKPPGAVIPRMLFKDPVEEVWVDPESFYSFGDERFYVQENSPETLLSDGLSVRPLQAPAWHGPPTTSLLFECSGQELFLSSDTVYDPELWKNLTQQHPQDSNRTAEFEEKYYLENPLENYVEQTWSEERLRKALAAYDRSGPCLHDVSGPDSTVHTSYDEIEHFDRDLLLTHSPDEFVATHPLAHLGKTYELHNGNLLERTRTGDCHPPTADCYVKKYSDYYVGYEDPGGNYFLVKWGPGNYDVTDERPGNEEDYEKITPVALYRDIGGEYFPILESEDEEYFVRADDAVVKLTHNQAQTAGVTVTGHREDLGRTSETTRS